MRIALVSPDDLSTVLFCKGLVRTLKTENDPDICTVNGYVEGFENYASEIASWGQDHVYVPMYRFLSPLRDLKYLYSLCRVYRRKSIDLAIHWTTKPNIYGPIAARIARVHRTVVAVRGLGSVFQPDTGLKARILRTFLLSLYRLSCHFASLVWFTNEGDLEYFLAEGVTKREKVVLTKNAIDIAHYSRGAIADESLENLRKELQIGSGSKVVVMVARLIWPKGVKEFVEAADQLRKTRPDVVFVLVAPPETGSSLAVPESYLIDRQKCNNNLRWLGFRKDVRELYALSDLAVLPSYYKEGGFPRALLEPMAMGKAVITTDTPDCRAPVEVGKNGLLVPPRDSAALAAAIDTIIGNDAICRQFGTYSRCKIENEFDERTVIQTLLARVRDLDSQNGTKDL
jgi:N,N'-diacetylbacillosaminyl-diphospho-undecaprenol alpha-1,3-N-acetylgalactosaminyltransferase